MKKTIFPQFYFFLIFLFFFSSSQAQDSAIIKIDAPDSPRKIVIKYGIASYYAKKFIGRTTSDGSTYNSKILTAACNVLPLGTWVKVTNLKNNKSVIVLINDHMHRKNKRLIDLSKSAAQKLSFISSGTTRVKIEVLGDLKKRRAHKKKFRKKELTGL
ncbi:MAG: septal ring lytic transglycosylase RlpA family protein [Ginsengibacter sp.]